MSPSTVELETMSKKTRLVDFPFNPSPDESFPFTFNSLDNLDDKLRKKKRRLELKLIKNPPKKLSSKQKKIIGSEKERKTTTTATKAGKFFLHKALYGKWQN